MIDEKTEREFIFKVEEKRREIIKEKEREHDRRMGFARGKAAEAWCTPTTKSIVFDPILAEEFAEILCKEMYEPHLGCATTGELLKELEARFDDLDYRTIDEN
jgi:hypothetical protein